MVKGVKKSFMRAMGDTKLSLNEMNTMMAEISNLVNERPIGLKPNTHTDPEYLSPNSLYLGRASDRISSGPFHTEETFIDDPSKVQSRFLLVQTITNQFWKIWLKLYFPTLLFRQKWHNEKRNMKVGDVCLLKDAKTFRAEWRLARVTATFPDRRGKVRNVEVRVVRSRDSSRNYKPVQSNYLKRHVSNLIVLVPAEDQVKVDNDSKGEDVSENEANMVKENEVNDESNDEEKVDEESESQSTNDA